MKARYIGILGGSFNPPHLGHLAISKQALGDFSLDEIWWHITPQNPLKSTLETQSYAIRKSLAENIIDQENIIISDFEKDHQFIYTIDTIRALKTYFPNDKFILLMGEDCFSQIHLWKKWQEILQSIPIAIFPRPQEKKEPYQVELDFPHLKRHYGDRMKLLTDEHNGWTICNKMQPIPISSTMLRKEK